MKLTLQAIEEDEELILEVIVTGMHLLGEYGKTYKEIFDAGFNEQMQTIIPALK